MLRNSVEQCSVLEWPGTRDEERGVLEGRAEREYEVEGRKRRPNGGGYQGYQRRSN